MPVEVIVLGAVIGLGYGLVAAGLILAFRSSGVLNMAQGGTAALAAAVVAYVVQRWNVPYGWALVLGCAAGAAIGALVELVVVRRLRSAPPLLSLVATLGVAQGLGFLAVALIAELPPGEPLPQPDAIGTLQVGSLELNPAQVCLLLVAPLAVLALAVLLRRTLVGAALRGAADNPDAARALGIPAPALSTLAWALAGGLAGLTGPLVEAGSGIAGVQSLGPDLLVRAFAAAVVAALASLPLALAGGVAIGVAEQVTLWHSDVAGMVDAVVLAIAVCAVIARPRLAMRLTSAGSWAAFTRWRPLPAAARGVPLVRAVRAVAAVAALTVAALAPIVLGPADEVLLLQIASFALIGVGAWVVAGLTGGVPLAQVAIAGLGAVMCTRLGNPALGLAAAVGAGAVAGALITVPARNDQALLLAVVSLAAALAGTRALLPRDWALGEGRTVEGLDLGLLNTANPDEAYWLALAMLLAGTLLAAALARSGAGRRMIAARDNQFAARAFGISPARTRLQAAAIAGSLAAVGGAALALGSTSIGPQAFSAGRGIDVVAVAALGGLAFAGGPLLGALYVLGLPLFLDLPSTGLAASALGWLLLLLYAPAGLGGLAERARDRVVRGVLRVAGQDPGLADPSPAPAAPPPRPEVVREGARSDSTALAATDLKLRFGEVDAVDGVGLDLREGEILGLIGPNGAGKTSLLDVLSGFAAPQNGRVVLKGRDLRGLAPERRARLGLVRCFQQATLFPTMTVRDVVALAAREPDARREMLERFGLTPYADHFVRELSTGTRRVVELACAVALRPRVLLLDEPSAGLAHAEIEPLAHLLRAVRDETGAAVVLVEHDLPLVFGLADCVAVMERGRVVALGAPEAIAAERTGMPA